MPFKSTYIQADTTGYQGDGHENYFEKQIIHRIFALIFIIVRP